MKTHGMTKTRIFNIWITMKQRCYNPNKQHYECYGGRGVKVCQEWLYDFMKFYEWAMNNGYEESLTLDRIDMNGNYEPFNCRWVDLKTQANNKRNNCFVEWNGEVYTIAELSEISGINYSVMYYRIHKGWDIDKAVSIQPQKGRNQYG